MLRVRTLVLTALLVAIVALDAVADPAPAQTSLSATSEPPRAFGVGYQRGTGLGYYGTSFAMAATDRWTPSLAVFGFYDDGERGFALAPSIKLSVMRGFRSSPFVAGGVQYLRMWFGDASGGGFGGYGTVGWALRFQPGIEIDLGIGLHGRQAISGTDGMVTVEQAASFGPHWDAAVRYWFE